MLYRVLFQWDNEARVWTATSNDVPGLVLESASFERLVKRVKLAIPELLELNGQEVSEYQVSFQTERCERVASYG